MKRKKYIKPDFAVERFELSQVIASGCTAVGGDYGSPGLYLNQSTCFWEAGQTRYFNSQMNCDEGYDIGPDEEFGGICYHAPAGLQTAFGSI